MDITVSPARDDPPRNFTADDAPTAGDKATRGATIAPALPTIVSFLSQNPGSNASSLSIFSALSELGVNFGSKLSDVFVIDRSRAVRTDVAADVEGITVIPGSD